MKQVMTGTGIGILIGILFEMTVFGPLSIVVRDSQMLSSFLGAIHMPGLVIVMSWLILGFPPHGDASIDAMRFAPVVQWTIVGIIVGLVWSRIKRRI